MSAQPSRVFEGNVYTQLEIEKEAESISASEIDNIIRNKLGRFSIEVLAVSTHNDLPFSVESNTTVARRASNGQILYIATNGADVKVYETSNNGSTSLAFEGVKNSSGEIVLKREGNGQDGDYDFCHREKGETASQCNDREYDEFVEGDWAAFIAYWTHPAIPVMIALMCQC